MSIKDLLLLLTFIKPNRDFFKMIDDFRAKLPPKQKKAVKTQEARTGITILNTTNMRMHISEQEIDEFQKKLENFRYNKILFRKKRIISYSKNLQRIIQTSEWDKFGIAMIQDIIEDENWFFALWSGFE